jgi:large subunit ribosomal protein L32e
MAEEKKKTTAARKKPKFLRTDWHKKIRLGRGVKKNQKWHGAKGRQNKFRLNRKGRGVRPRVGWGAENETKGFVNGLSPIRVENVKMLEGLKGVGIIVASVGKKKRAEIIKKAEEMKLVVLNRYLKEETKNAAS